MGSAWGKAGLFAGGLLFGTAGLKILGSKDAKKVYAHTTAAVLRAKRTVHRNKLDPESRFSKRLSCIFGDRT